MLQTCTLLALKTDSLTDGTTHGIRLSAAQQQISHTFRPSSEGTTDVATLDTHLLKILGFSHPLGQLVALSHSSFPWVV